MSYNSWVADVLFDCYHTYKEVMPMTESFEPEGVAGGGAL
jgi:hypothetical protein